MVLLLGTKIMQIFFGPNDWILCWVLSKKKKEVMFRDRVIQ